MYFLKILYKKNENFKDFIIKNGNFFNFLNTKSDPNIYTKTHHLSKARRFARYISRIAGCIFLGACPGGGGAQGACPPPRN